MPGIDFVRASSKANCRSRRSCRTSSVRLHGGARRGGDQQHPGFRHYNPIGSVHGATRDPAGFGDGLAFRACCGRHRLHHARIQISFIKGMSKDTGAVRTEGRTLNVGRRAATAKRASPTPRPPSRHATTTCLVFEIQRGRRVGSASHHLYAQIISTAKWWARRKQRLCPPYDSESGNLTSAISKMQRCGELDCFSRTANRAQAAGPRDAKRTGATHFMPSITRLSPISLSTQKFLSSAKRPPIKPA